MKSWPQGIGAVTLFVEDLKATKTFHREVFGLPVAFEDDDSAVFDFGNTIVNLLKTTAALELIEPAVVAGPGTGSRLQLPPPAPASSSPSRWTTWTPCAPSWRRAA